MKRKAKKFWETPEYAKRIKEKKKRIRRKAKIERFKRDRRRHR